MKNLIPYFIHEQFQRGKMAGRFQAATLFIDLSGFTPLTETLQHQRDGAEVLNEALERIFAPLVQEVVGRGGIIPLYAGDAFAAMFVHQPDGDADAPLQACYAAFNMRDHFAQQETARLNTKYGDFELGARVGLGYGEIEWGILGWLGRHNFYFRGEGMQNCSQAQRAAAQGEIVAHASISPFIEELAALEPMDQASFFRVTQRQREPAPLFKSYPPFSRDALVPFAPDQVIDLPVKAEFRDICPVFVSFQEPHEQASFHRFGIQIIELCYQHGGKVAQIDFGDHGPLVLCYFGAPTAYENNSERAVKFLLALKRLDLPLVWRAGLTHGPVWAGIRGGKERCEYGAVGSAVNLACRLATRAEWGQIWATSTVVQRLEHTHRFRTIGSFQFKGVPGEIEVFCLLERRQVAQIGYYTDAMIGRERELSQLLAFVRPIFEGRFAGVLTVYGEAGMGKSHLIYELRRRIASAATSQLWPEPRAAVKWFFCPADEILRQSLNPFRYFLRRYFRQSAHNSGSQNKANFDASLETLITAVRHANRSLEFVQELERTRSFLGALVDLRWDGSLYEQLDPRLRFENTLRSFRSLVQAESLRQPVVIQVEDLHWLDSDSHQLLQVLTSQMANFAVAVVGTSRYRDTGDRVMLNLPADVPHQTVDLQTLEPAGVQTFAARILDRKTYQHNRPLMRPVTAETATYLLEKTGGNPFFVEQLALDLHERGLLEPNQEGAWHLESSINGQVPATINAVLVARLDRLVSHVRQAVQAAAVLGREFHVQILSRMLKGEWHETLSWVRQAEEEQIWRSINGLRYIFRHALMRDAAYEMQLRSRVRQLHRLAMEAIEELYPPQARGPFFADLVYHAHNANDVWRERRYAHLAGEYAAERFANEEALQYFTRALELTPAEDLLERYALLMAREDVYYLQGLRQAKLQDLKAAQRLAEALDQGELAGLARRAEVALRQARHAEQTGDYATAAAAAQKAVHLARDAEDASQEAAGYLWLGRVLQRQGQDRMARAQLQQALDLARKTGIYQVEINSLRILGTVYLNHYANDGRARTCYRQSLEICRRVNDRQGESRALRRLGNVSLGHPFLEQSSYEDAQQNYLGSLEVSRAIGFRVGEAGALNNLGETEHCLGRLGEAESYYVDALSIFREIGEQLGICVVLGNLCRLFHDLGAYAAALEHGQQALQIAHDMKVPEFVGVSSIDLALAHEGLGQWDEASQAYQHVFTVRRQLGFLHLSMEALAGLVRAALAKDDLPLALHYVEQIMAHEAERQSTGEEDFFRIRLACFRALQAAGDPRAPAVLDQAHQFLQAQASKIQDPALRQSFLQKVPVHRQIRLAWQAQEAG